MSKITIWMYGEDYGQDVCPLIRSFCPGAELMTHYVRAAQSPSLTEKEESGKEELVCRFVLLPDLMELCLRKDKEECFSETVRGEYPERRNYRNELLRLVYRAFSSVFHKELPWGTLTGVRPAKLVYERLDVMEDREIADYMRKEYYCRDEKIEVSLTTAKREKELLSELRPEEGYSLYLGIPFCPTTCLYCSFTSYPLERFSAFIEPYLAALKKEIRCTARLMNGHAPTSIYIGGGTPTTLSAGQLQSLIECLKEEFECLGVREFTVEAGRPDSLNYEKLAVLKELGADRISINPQSMCQETLDLIGRRHTVEQIEEAVGMARKAGHENINMDLIIGLTGETPEHVRRTLDRIRPLNPESLTVHTLALKRAARLNQERDHYRDKQAEGVEEMQRMTAAYAKENGYSPYYLYRQKNMAENLENIGYAKYGRECLYNIMIMEERQTILALGAGASSKFYFPSENRLERVENVKSLKDYVERIEEMIERKVNFVSKNRVLLQEGSLVW